MDTTKEENIKRIFWLAGEKSGDLHASYVIREMNNREGNYFHYGIGGYQMSGEGFKSMFPFNRFNVMGFIEVISHLRFFFDVEKSVRIMFLENPPDLVVLVDYPGFNLRIAKMATEMHIKVLYYICPQFWAWKHSRVHKLAENTDHVASIIPFEKELLDVNRVACSYVGHPIAEEIEYKLNKQEFAAKYRLNPLKKWISFLPGSREAVVRKHLPVFLKTISLMDNSEYEFLISKADTIAERTFEEIIQSFRNVKYTTIYGYNYEMMKYSDAMAVTSGTSTLEAALIGTPFLIVYRTSRLSYEIGKRIIKIRRIGLPNIILNKDVIPELIQQEAHPRHIREMLVKMIENEKYVSDFKKEIAELKEILGSKSASAETANIIEEMLE